MRKLLDEDGAELSQILEALLQENVDITVREVGRRHSALKNPSAFTRNPTRMAAIRAAQQRQRDARSAGIDRPGSETSLQMQLIARNERIRELEAQVQALVASHAACIRAVMLHGGTSALERFWKEYKTIADDVASAGGMPPAAEVVHIKKV